MQYITGNSRLIIFSAPVSLCTFNMFLINYKTLCYVVQLLKVLLNMYFLVFTNLLTSCKTNTSQKNVYLTKGYFRKYLILNHRLE